MNIYILKIYTFYCPYLFCQREQQFFNFNYIYIYIYQIYLSEYYTIYNIRWIGDSGGVIGDGDVGGGGDGGRKEYGIGFYIRTVNLIIHAPLCYTMAWSKRSFLSAWTSSVPQWKIPMDYFYFLGKICRIIDGNNTFVICTICIWIPRCKSIMGQASDLLEEIRFSNREQILERGYKIHHH